MTKTQQHTKAQKPLVPELRFREFEGEWKKRILKDFTKINQGLQISIAERYNEQIEGSYFYITNEFLRQGSKKSYFIKNPTKSVLCSKEDILMTRTGNTGKVVTGVEGAFHNNFFKIKFDESCEKWFLYFFLTAYKTQHKILTLAGTSTIPDLNHGDFYKLKIIIPKYDEQQKIASFLITVDEKIQQFTKKKALLEQYKKGIMQQLFSGHLRFKDENGNDYPDWDWVGGNELFDNISDKNHNSDLHILAITQDQGAIPRDMIDYQMTVTEKSIASYKVVQVGDFVISLRTFQGGIEFSDYHGICSPAYIILRPSSDDVDRTYYKFYLKTSFYIKQLQKNLEGIRDGKMISYKYFSEIKLPFPTHSEQQKIASYLSSINTKIENVNQQITQTQNFKKGLLQKMFV